MIKKLFLIFFYLFWSTVVFRIDALVFSEKIFFDGFLNFYQSHFLYLSDLFFVLSILFLGLAFIFRKDFELKIVFKNKPFLLILSVFLFFSFLSIFIGIDPLNSFFYFLRLCQFVALFWLVVNNFVDLKKCLYILITVVSFNALIGIMQFGLQSSLGLHFLGEPVLNGELKNVAKMGLFDMEIIRAYGLFLHPNIFAAYLIFALIFLVHFFRKSFSREKLLFGILFLLNFGALILTFSRSAYLAVFVLAIFSFAVFKIRISLKYLLSIFVFLILFVLIFDLSQVLVTRFSFFSDTAVSERIELMKISRDMLLDNPLGIGHGNFTSAMQIYSAEKLFPWNYQPVHNLYLLAFNELGVFGGFTFLALLAMTLYLLIARIKNKNFLKNDLVYSLISIWIALFVLGFFDHYFWTIYQGMAIFWFLFAAMLNPYPRLLAK